MNKLKWIFIFCMGCTMESQTDHVDIQGHRGARGLAPENTIPAFIIAADLGVSTLELDVVVSKDTKIVVSHEPYFSPDFCLDPSGVRIAKDSIINIYELNYEEIAKYDCGTVRNYRFPEQKRIAVYKPLLQDVIDSVDRFMKRKNWRPISYNIELKTQKKYDTIFHPKPEEFSDLVYLLISKLDIWDRVTIQSFDFRTLQYFHEKYPHVKLALLIENEVSWEQNIDSLGFRPAIYSCDFELLSQQNVEEIQAAGMQVIPWTVNDFFDINRMFAWNVDGIITDYPDRALIITKTK